MATVIVHHTPCGGPVDASALVDGPTYDADPHIVTGLENVDNTSDANKPVSTAQAAAIAVVAANTRTKLSAPLTLYVNPSSTTAALFDGASGGVGSDSNPGTLAAPFLTPNKAVAVALTNYDVAQSQITIQYADNNITGATYPVLRMQANLVGAISGSTGSAAQLIIKGNSSTRANVIVQGAATVAAFTFVAVTSPVLIRSMQIGSTLVGGATTGHGILADAHSMVYYSDTTWGFVDTAYSHKSATFGSFIEQQGIETIIGGAGYHEQADRGSEFVKKGFAVTVTGTPAFASGFLFLQNGSRFTNNGVVYTGAATGTRYIADYTSSLGTPDPNSYLPGNVNGAVTPWDSPAFSTLIDNQGGQIKFPASQSASAGANTLDDYEEGTGTPVLAFGGASVGITYSTQEMDYTKIGNQVTLWINLILTSKGSSVGTASITGAPFAAAKVAAISITMNNGAAAVTTQVMGNISSSTINLQKFAAGAITNMADTDFTNTTVLRVTVTYRV